MKVLSNNFIKSFRHKIINIHPSLLPKYKGLDSHKKVLKNNNIEIAGIEFVEDNNGELFTYDINTNTNYNSIAESLSDFKGMKAIAEFLNKELNK